MKASDIRRGHVLMIDGNPCRVMDFQHRTPGNLRAFVQVRLRNLTTGNTFDTRLSATELVDAARLDTKDLQVMYRDANGVHVMDSKTYDQYTFDDEIAGDQVAWLESGHGARLSNGVTIQVPEFINEGERVRVNPREGVYLERAK